MHACVSIMSASTLVYVSVAHTQPCTMVLTVCMVCPALCCHSLAGVNVCCCGGDISCPLPGHDRRDESSPRGEEVGDAAGDNGTGTPEPTAGGKAKLLA
jgi:hypothetical protein